VRDLRYAVSTEEDVMDASVLTTTVENAIAVITLGSSRRIYFFDRAIALCESMSKPVVVAISGTCLAGGFEFALSCDLRIAQDGDYLIGLPEVNLGLLPGAGGTQELLRTIGSAAALLHILMGGLASRPPEAVG
jgi:enoyl-CoA hydratase/carnithine racemase